jgi:hypothetical protein
MHEKVNDSQSSTDGQGGQLRERADNIRFKGVRKRPKVVLLAGSREDQNL